MSHAAPRSAAASVIIADDHPLFRAALRETVGRLLAGAEVVEAQDMASLERATEHTIPLLPARSAAPTARFARDPGEFATAATGPASRETSPATSGTGTATGRTGQLTLICGDAAVPAELESTR